MNIHHDSNVTNSLLSLGPIDPEYFNWSDQIFHFFNCKNPLKCVDFCLEVRSKLSIGCQLRSNLHKLHRHEHSLKYDAAILCVIMRTIKCNRSFGASPILSPDFALHLHFWYCTSAVSTIKLHMTQWICMHIEI